MVSVLKDVWGKRLEERWRPLFTVHTQLRVTLQGNSCYNLVFAAHFLLLHWQQPASQFRSIWLCYSSPDAVFFPRLLWAFLLWINFMQASTGSQWRAEKIYHVPFFGWLETKHTLFRTIYRGFTVHVGSSVWDDLYKELSGSLSHIHLFVSCCSKFMPEEFLPNSAFVA